jgi:hypothetical protein
MASCILADRHVLVVVVVVVVGGRGATNYTKTKINVSEYTHHREKGSSLQRNSHLRIPL